MGAYRKLWWTLIAVLTVTFAILGISGVEVYRNAPPIPAKVVSASGEVLMTREDISLLACFIGAYAILDQLRSEGRSGAPPTAKAMRAVPMLEEYWKISGTASTRAVSAWILSSTGRGVAAGATKPSMPKPSVREAR